MRAAARTGSVCQAGFCPLPALPSVAWLFCLLDPELLLARHCLIESPFLAPLQAFSTVRRLTLAGLCGMKTGNESNANRCSEKEEFVMTAAM